ncbi:AAA family ATPase [Streptomyces lasalocidi]
MDGFRPEVPTLVIGTTNRLNLIDEALLRPSRFESIAIDLPNDEARLKMISLHAAKFGIDVGGGVDELIASALRGRNGDDIHSVFRDAFVAAHFQDPRCRPPPSNWARSSAGCSANGASSAARAGADTVADTSDTRQEAR